MPRIFHPIQPGLITREVADALNEALGEVGRLVQGISVAPPLCISDDAAGVKISMSGGSGTTSTVTVVSNVECAAGVLTVYFRDLTFDGGILTTVGAEY